MKPEGILNRKVDKATQQPSHSQDNDPHQGTLMVNRKEGLFVEKPLHDDKKEPKKARFGERQGRKGRRQGRKRGRRRHGRGRHGGGRHGGGRHPDTKKTDGRTA